MKLKLTALFLIVVGLSVYVYPKSHGRHFVTPSKSTCLRHGGRWNSNFDVCQASWSKAKKICRTSGGRLPSLNEFKRVIRSCGGVPIDGEKMGNERHRTNSLCYKRLGIRYIFHGDYWTSTAYYNPQVPSYLFKKTVAIASGYYMYDDRVGPNYITCVR